MKKYIYIGTAFLSFLGVSCDDSFLEKEPNQQFSPEQIGAAAEKDPSLLTGSVNGLYATMYNIWTGGTENHDDFGQKGYDIYSDLLVSDMALGGTNYKYYVDLARFQPTTNNTLLEAYIPWRYYYRIILGANTVIDALGGTDAPQTDPLKRQIMGQAKAMRAYAYFYLAQFYSTGYGDGTEKILPLYKDSKSPNQPKSTAAEVYNLIVSDLTQAIDYLNGFNRASKDQINQAVAKGLLAYALAARGSQADLEKVVTLTDEVMNNYGFRLTTQDETVARFDPSTNQLLNPQAGFNNVATPSWMWGVDLTIAINLDLVSWWGQVDLFTYSYAWAGDSKLIDQSLYDAIRADDIRKRQFSTSTSTRLMPINKFFDPNRKPGGQRNITSDYVYMRVDEMLLLNAEAKARLGQAGPAREMLKKLLALRLTNFSYVDNLNGQALLDEIYLQTRIELWGEGKAYLAMKRNKRTVTRGANHLYEAGKSFAWNSDELTFPIPQAEVINNPVLNQ